MNLVEFFGTVIKPKKVKGKGMMHPLETGNFNDDVFFIRDKDVNAFFIKSDNGYLAIDSGYKNSENILNGLKQLNIHPNDIKNVILTHLDLDHAGGLDYRCNIIYPVANVYLGAEESKYLNKTYSRKVILGIKLPSPVQLKPNYTLVNDNEELNIDGISVKAFLTPGHTLGHLSYLINGYLFVGDTMILGKDGGYCFWDFWNTDSVMNKESLNKLDLIARVYKVKAIFTSHNGMTEDIDFAFKHKDTYIDWNKKGFVFDEDAPFDAYK